MAATAKKVPLPWLKPAVLCGSLLPLVDMGISGARGTLGANPIEEVLNRLGLIALVLLVGSISLTPMKLLFGWTWPVRIRRWSGNLAFTYVLLHFLTYAVADHALNLGRITEDITKRPFILVGFLAFLLLIPLAVTSTDAAVKRLGYVRWKRLHRLAYVATGLGALHYFLRVKADITEPVVIFVIVAALLGVRVYDHQRHLRAKRARAAP